MNKLFTILLTALLLSTTSCSTVHSIFHRQTAIEKTTTKLNDTQDQRLDEIGKLSYGVGLALNDNTNVVAKELNDRVEAIANPPSLQDIKSIQLIVSDLMQNNQRLLDIEDKKIQSLQSNIEHLNLKLNNQVQTQLKAAEVSAVELSKYKGWFGLKAVYQGLKTLCLSSIWILVGTTVVFIVLRFAAASNPLAATAFAVFEHVVSYALKAIVSLFPKAANFAGFVAKEIEK